MSPGRISYSRCIPVLALMTLGMGGLLPLKADLPSIGFWKVGQEVGDYGLVSEKESRTSIASIKGKYKVIFYFSENDGQTASRLLAVKNIMGVFNSPDVAYLMVWERKVRWKELKNDNMPLENSYVVQSPKNDSSAKPSWSYLIDAQNQILINGFYGYGDIVERLNTLLDVKKSQSNAMAILNRRLGEEGGDKIDPAKKDLFFFYRHGCGRCEAEAKLVRERLNVLRDRFNVFVVTPDTVGGNPSREGALSEATIIDYGGILFKVLEPARDPFFIIADERGRMEKEMETLAEVMSYRS